MADATAVSFLPAWSTFEISVWSVTRLGDKGHLRAGREVRGQGWTRPVLQSGYGGVSVRETDPKESPRASGEGRGSRTRNLCSRNKNKKQNMERGNTETPT